MSTHHQRPAETPHPITSTAQELGDEPGLFETPTPVTVPGQRTYSPTPDLRAAQLAAGGAVTNDIDLVAAVLRLAIEPGYVLVAKPEQVWRRRTRRGSEVDAAAVNEAAAVRQLLREGLLTLGGPQQVGRDCYTASGRSVLVPASTRTTERRLARTLAPRPRGGHR